MIWMEKGADNFVETSVLPPGVKHKIKGFCAGPFSAVEFIDALAISLSRFTDEDNTPLLEALRKKYPEAVETYMPEAKRLIQEAVLAVQA